MNLGHVGEMRDQCAQNGLYMGGTCKQWLATVENYVHVAQGVPNGMLRYPAGHCLGYS